jgi:hypothetical protein
MSVHSLAEHARIFESALTKFWVLLQTKYPTNQIPHGTERRSWISIFRYHWEFIPWTDDAEVTSPTQSPTRAPLWKSNRKSSWKRSNTPRSVDGRYQFFDINGNSLGHELDDAEVTSPTQSPTRASLEPHYEKWPHTPRSVDGRYQFFDIIGNSLGHELDDAEVTSPTRPKVQQELR